MKNPSNVSIATLVFILGNVYLLMFSHMLEKVTWPNMNATIVVKALDARMIWKYMSSITSDWGNSSVMSVSDIFHPNPIQEVI